MFVVDDDPNVADVVTRYLENEGFEVESMSDGNAALERALVSPPDLVVLDLMLPGIGGLEVCRRLRAVSPVPVIMLTARSDEADRVVGLELGADDYVAKPFSVKELTARVKAVLRRASGPLAASVPGTPAMLTDDDLEVDVAGRLVRRSGAPVTLTAREFELLVFLMRGCSSHSASNSSTSVAHTRSTASGDLAALNWSYSQRSATAIRPAKSGARRMAASSRIMARPRTCLASKA